MATISGTINHGITLTTSGVYASPLTITTTGAVDASSGNAITGSNGGYIDNAGLIQGGNSGVYISGAAGTVTNSGTIVSNAGAVYAVELSAGGSVANNADLIEGNRGVRIAGGAGTVVNSGTILANDGNGVYLGAANGSVVNQGTITAAFYGVRLINGGYVGNNAGGLIEGSTGVVIANAAGTVTNTGTILGTNGYAVKIGVFGGSLANDAGLIEGYSGVYIRGTAGTVTNSATIVATGTSKFGVELIGSGELNNAGLIEGSRGVFWGGAMVTNSGTIIGTAGYGISLLDGATVVDSGTISGGGGTAVSFGGTGGNLLVLEHGYQLNGVVAGSASATNTVELAGSVGGAVTVNYNGLGLTNFQDVLFGPGGDDTLKVTNISGTLPVTISGFALTSDIIDLTAIGTNGTIASQSGTEVTISGSSGSETLLLDASDSSIFGVVSDGASGTELIACYRRGTRIRTTMGEVPVEALAIGDKVVTVAGAARPVKWIGRRAYDGRFVAGNRAVLPIRIEAGALADGIPARDLDVSPEHALLIPGSSPGTDLLVPARLLANGITIRQVESVERLEYFHIELDTHDAILAEGAPAETFVDCDNRFMFQNAAEFGGLYPDDRRPAWEFCAPRIEPGSAGLHAIRRALLARAEALGRVTHDPDLHLVADGEVIRAQSVAGRIWRFALPAGVRALAIASRSVVPAETEAAAADGRALGVAVERIILGGGGRRVEIGHDCADLGEGFHADEGSHRWTDGRGSLPAALLGRPAGALSIEVHLAETVLRYRADPPAGERPDATLPSEKGDWLAVI